MIGPSVLGTRKEDARVAGVADGDHGRGAVTDGAFLLKPARDQMGSAFNGGLSPLESYGDRCQSRAAGPEIEKAHFVFRRLFSITLDHFLLAFSPNSGRFFSRRSFLARCLIVLMLRLSLALIRVHDLPAAIKSRSRFSSSGVQRAIGITQSFSNVAVALQAGAYSRHPFACERLARCVSACERPAWRHIFSYFSRTRSTLPVKRIRQPNAARWCAKGADGD